MTETPPPRARYLGDGRYLIESRSRPGMGHQVHPARGTCSCASGKHRGRCWHLTIARQMEQWRTQPRPLMMRPSGMAALQEAFV